MAHRREARPRRRGRDRDHRRRQAVRPHADPQRAQPRPSRQPDLDGARPVGDRQERADQAHRRPALPGLRRRPRPRRVGAEHDRRRALRDAQEVRPAVPGRRAVRLDERLRQHVPSRFVSTPTRARTRSPRSSTAACMEVGLAEAMDKMPNELSGGMRKRAGFARALVLDPAIVMFDEPDSGLDPVRTALLCELIREIHEENGGCYMVISHDLGTARRIADFIAVLWKGRIVESGPPQELFNSENEFVSQFLNAETVARWRWTSGSGLRRSGLHVTLKLPMIAEPASRRLAAMRAVQVRRRAGDRAVRWPCCALLVAPSAATAPRRLKRRRPTGSSTAGLGDVRRDRALQATASATTPSSSSSAATSSDCCSPTTSAACCGLEGCLAGDLPEGGQATAPVVRARSPSWTRRGPCSGRRPSSTRPRCRRSE